MYTYDEYLIKNVGNIGFFVDVGAATGIILNRYDISSHTFNLEKAGWNGICIEAKLDFITILLQNRKCIVHRAVVFNGTKQFFQNEDGDNFGSRIILNKTPNITTELLEDILDKYNIPNNIDFLKLDIEGSELTVLQTLSWKKYNYRYILIEIHNNAYDINNFLISHGYVKIDRGDPYNLFFERI